MNDEMIKALYAMDNYDMFCAVWRDAMTSAKRTGRSLDGFAFNIWQANIITRGAYNSFIKNRTHEKEKDK